MQDAVRSRGNHALEYAIQEANHLRKPLIALFALTPRFPEATISHYSFLADGLADVMHSLAERGIRFQVLEGDPGQVVPSAAEDASLLVSDFGHLRIQRQWRQDVWDRVSCPKVAVETGVIVPVAAASPKQEWSAGTFRPKITRLLPDFLKPVEPAIPVCSSLGWDHGGLKFTTSEDLLTRLFPDTPVPKGFTHGGEVSAQAQLSWFTANRLRYYGDSHSDPTARATSRLSAYLHFGHISPVDVALAVIGGKSPGSATFLEQLIVRRELATNFVYYSDGYDRYEAAVPDWAKKTLNLHQHDSREYTYSLADLEAGKTHDPYWNAMQTEMVLTGFLHGYLRMYWGKKILEWSETPEGAYDTALYLNNRYQLDGRDPNGYAGVAWCFGRHDRPWKERPVFGMVRYMNAAGLRRKFRIDAYCERVWQMAADIRDGGISAFVPGGSGSV